MRTRISNRWFYLGRWIDLSKFLYNEDILIQIKKEKHKFPAPSNYSNFFTLFSENFRYMYGSVFEPHVDKPEISGERRWAFQFCLWEKDCVFFHTVGNKIVVVEPTLKPIWFNYRKLHGFIPKRHVENIESKTQNWWKKRADYYIGRLLFIGKFVH